MAEANDQNQRHLKAYWAFAAGACLVAALCFGFAFTSMFASRAVAVFLAIPSYAAGMVFAACAVLLAIFNTVMTRPKPLARVQQQFKQLWYVFAAAFAATVVALQFTGI